MCDAQVDLLQPWALPESLSEFNPSPTMAIDPNWNQPFIHIIIIMALTDWLKSELKMAWGMTQKMATAAWFLSSYSRLAPRDWLLLSLLGMHKLHHCLLNWQVWQVPEYIHSETSRNSNNCWQTTKIKKTYIYYIVYFKRTIYIYIIHNCDLQGVHTSKENANNAG